MDLEQPGAIERELNDLRRRVERLEHELAALRSERCSDDRSQAPAAVPPPPKQSLSEPLPVLADPTAISETNAERLTVPRFTSSAAPSPSMENRLGSQVFNRVGIIALLIGTALSLKWAVDNHWIGELGRVLIGLLAGAGLVVWSERFRSKGYAAFSYSLKAVGTGILFLSLWAGFHLYHLMPAAVALGAMVLVTAWNAFMAWSQDAEMLAAYALIGGFATPVLLSSGGNHEVFLFGYLLAMNLAVLALVRLKPWSRLLLGSVPATVAYFIGWYVTWFYRGDAAGVTALFVGLLSASLAAVAVIALQRNGVVAGVLTPTVAAAFAALGWYSVLQDSGRHSWLPWEMVALAAFYLALQRLQTGREKTEPASSVHLAIAVVFLTIAIPLKASGRWITVGWLVEGVALLWVAKRIASLETEQATDSHVAWVLRWLACSSLLLGWIGAAMQGIFVGVGAETTLWNARFATELTGVAAMAAAAAIAWRTVSDHQADGDKWKIIAAIAMIGGNLLALAAGVREITIFWGPGGDAELAEALSVSGFLMIYGVTLLASGFWRRSGFVRWQGLVLLVFTIFKVFVYDMRSLNSGYRVISFVALGAMLMAVSFAYQKKSLAIKDK